MQFMYLGLIVFLGAVALLSAAIGGWGWLLFAAVAVGLIVLGFYDLLQKKHSILRNFPVLGHLRFLLEGIRPEIQQYFVERNWDGRPFDRDTRSTIYERAKNTLEEQPFGTERDVDAPGYEYLVHSAHPLPPPAEIPRVRIGGKDCTKPYDMALMNVSAMSYGALSRNAIEALNKGAAKGGFAHDTGEGGISQYHRNGGDLVWEIGSGYFGCRTADGNFDPEKFRAAAAHDQVKMVSLKLSQGAKPGIGGVLPGAKVTAEIAGIRGVPQGEKCISPPAHKVFSTPRELVRFIAHMRELADGKPTGFKMCLGSRVEFLSICKAMLAEGITPDFIIVDGGEGGTGAAPLEYVDHVGTPLTEGLLNIHNALVGTGLRDQIKLGASGKVSTGIDIVKRLLQGADFTNSARSMMMAVGCIQAQQCHTDACPVGVATQNPRLYRALDVPSKSDRVFHYQKHCVDQAIQVMSSMGIAGPHQLRPDMLRRRIDHKQVLSYAEIFQHLKPGELLKASPKDHWASDWALADADAFNA